MTETKAVAQQDCVPEQLEFDGFYLMELAGQTGRAWRRVFVSDAGQELFVSEQDPGGEVLFSLRRPPDRVDDETRRELLSLGRSGVPMRFFKPGKLEVAR